MESDEDTPQFRMSRFLRPGEDRMIQLVQETLRQSRLQPVEMAVADKIAAINFGLGSPKLRAGTR